MFYPSWKEKDGIRILNHNDQMILSSGNSLLDNILEGGLPTGSIIAIEEDTHAYYSQVLAKFFLAEGLVHDHPLLVATREEDPATLIKEIPTPTEDVFPFTNAELRNIPLTLAQKVMCIICRLNKWSVVNTKPKSGFGHYFDLYKQIEESDITESVKYWRGDPVPSDILNSMFQIEDFQTLLDCIHDEVSKPCFDPTNKEIKEKKPLRICLNSIGSPLWYDESFSEDLLKFITILKSFVRNTLSCCLITLPIHLFRHLADDHLYERLIDKVDFCVALESFAGTDKKTDPAFKGFDGLLSLVKVSDFSMLTSYVPEERRFAFELHPRKFILKKLPPGPKPGDDDEGRGIKRKFDLL